MCHQTEDIIDLSQIRLMILGLLNSSNLTNNPSSDVRNDVNTVMDFIRMYVEQYGSNRTFRYGPPDHPIVIPTDFWDLWKTSGKIPAIKRLREVNTRDGQVLGLHEATVVAEALADAL